MFEKQKKDDLSKDTNTKFEEMETAEELGDGAFIAGAIVGGGAVAAAIVITQYFGGNMQYNHLEIVKIEADLYTV